MGLPGGGDVSHPFRGDVQFEQQYGGRQGHKIGRNGNGLGSAWGSTGSVDQDDDPDALLGRRPRMSDSRPLPPENSEDVEPGELPDISEALSCLTAKQAFVIGLRYGLRDGNEYALEDIAEIMGLSYQAVSDFEKRGLRALKKRLAGGGDG